MTRIAPRNLPKAEPPSLDNTLNEGANDFYGTTIPISAGRRMIVGVPLWSSAIELGGDIDTTNPTRIVSFAMGFGYNLVPNDELVTVTLTRLWFNENLVLDRTGTSGPAFHPSLKYVMYAGSDDQPVDPTIRRALGASKTPAFRDMIYIVFKRVPLHVFGLDRVPFVRAEFQDMTLDVAYVLEMSRLAASSNHPGTEDGDVSTVDWGRGRFYSFVSDGGFGGTDKLSVNVYDIDSNAMIATNRVQRSGLGDSTERPLTDTDPITVIPNTGYLFAGGVGPIMYVIDPMSGIVKGRKSIWSAQTCCSFPMRGVWLDGEDLGVQYAIAVSRFAVDDNSIRILNYYKGPGESFEVNVGGGHKETIQSLQTFFPTFTLDNEVKSMVGGELIELGVLQSNPAGVGGGVFYAADTRSVYRVFVPYRPYQMNNDRIVVTGQEYQYKSAPNLRVSKFWSNPSSSYVNEYLFFDAASEDVIVLYRHTGTGQRYIARIRHPQHGRPTRNNTGSVVSETVTGDVEYEGKTIPAFPAGDGSGWRASDISGGNLCIFVEATSEFALINLSNGSHHSFSLDWRYVGDSSNQPGDLSFRSSGAPWNSRMGYFIGSEFAYFDWSKIFVGRAPEGTTQLADILRWYLLSAGFTTGQIDIDGVDDLVYGTILKERVPIVTLLNNMGQVFNFDWYESEGKIKIRKKGVGTSLTIDLELDGDDELAWLTGSEGDDIDDSRRLLITRNNSDDKPPSGLEVKYLNVNANYSVDIAYAKRTSFPVQTSRGVSIVTIPVPIVLSPRQAGQYAHQALYRLWANQMEQEFRLPQQHVAVEPTDVLKITRAGYEHVVKVIQAGIEGDYSVSVVAVNYAIDNAVDIDADDPLQLPQDLYMPSLCTFWWLDTPRLDYQVDHQNDNLFTYVSVTSRGQLGWSGGTLYRSLGDGYVEVFHNRDDAVCAGVVSNVPDAPGGGGVIQDDIQLDLVVTIGDAADLEDATLLELCEDANFAFWGAPGRWEVIQYGTVVVSGQLATLTNIVRGRRGTEWAMRLHEQGDLFIDASQSIRSLRLPSDRLDLTVNIKVVGDRLDDDDAQYDQPTVTGNGDKCFAPTDLSAVLSGSDIILGWFRRTRYLSELVDSVDDTDLDEQTEEYEVEVLDGPGGAVVRTFTGLTADTQTYTASQISTDFGSTPTTLTFKVYQIGLLVGRGFAAEQTVDVL